MHIKARSYVPNLHHHVTDNGLCGTIIPNPLRRSLAKHGIMLVEKLAPCTGFASLKRIDHFPLMPRAHPPIHFLWELPLLLD